MPVALLVDIFSPFSLVVRYFVGVFGLVAVAAACVDLGGCGELLVVHAPPSVRFQSTPDSLPAGQVPSIVLATFGRYTSSSVSLAF